MAFIAEPVAAQPGAFMAQQPGAVTYAAPAQPTYTAEQQVGGTTIMGGTVQQEGFLQQAMHTVGNALGFGGSQVAPGTVTYAAPQQTVTYAAPQQTMFVTDQQMGSSQIVMEQQPMAYATEQQPGVVTYMAEQPQMVMEQ